MKIEVSILGKTRAVEIPDLRSQFEALVDGRTVEGTISSPQPGCYLVHLSDARILEVIVQPLDDGSLILQHQARDYGARILDLKHQRRSADVSDAGQLVIAAPMPGKVVSVLVHAGDQVESGTGIVVVEAMKMQNELKSSRSGVVKSVAVEAGQTVASGQTLVIIE